MSTDTLNIPVSASAGSRYGSGTQTSRGMNLKACPKCQGAVELKSTPVARSSGASLADSPAGSKPPKTARRIKMNLEEALQIVVEADSLESHLDGLGRLHEIACEKTGFPSFRLQHEFSPFKALSSIGKSLLFRDLETLRSSRTKKEKVKSLCRSIRLMQECSDLRIRLPA